MYYYIVDPAKLNQKEFERVQNDLYSSLSEFRISGEVVRVTGLRSIQQLVENAFAHDATTIVAVGGDDTLNEVVNCVNKREIVVGFIPIVSSELGNIFGVRDVAQAVKVIAFRRIEEMDLGTIANKTFLSQISFGLNSLTSPAMGIFGYKLLKELYLAPTFNLSFNTDGNFQATSEVVGGYIVNCKTAPDSTMGNPADGLLDLVLIPKLDRFQILRYRNAIIHKEFEKIPGVSVIHFKNLIITDPSGLVFRINNKEITKAPTRVVLEPKTLKLIVGRDRKLI